MSLGCDKVSAIQQQPPQRHLNVRMISATRTVGRGRGYSTPWKGVTEEATSRPGDSLAGGTNVTTSTDYSSAAGQDLPKGAKPGPPTEHSKAFEAICDDGDQRRTSTTQHDLDN